MVKKLYTAKKQGTNFAKTARKKIVQKVQKLLEI